MLWIMSITLLAIYITCMFTVCSLTFKKGYKVLGIVGIFFPDPLADRCGYAAQAGLAVRARASHEAAGLTGTQRKRSYTYAQRKTEHSAHLG